MRLRMIRAVFVGTALLSSTLLAQAHAAATSGPVLITSSASLTAPDLSSRSDFGGAAAISGDGATVVVGAKGQGAGRVYVFVRPRSGWKSAGRSEATLAEPASRPGDEFGSSVAISANGRVVLVAAYNGYQGIQVFVYKRRNSNWTSTARPEAVLTRSGLGPGAGFGYSVALSGDGRTALSGLRRITWTIDG